MHSGRDVVTGMTPDKLRQSPTTPQSSVDVSPASTLLHKSKPLALTPAKAAPGISPSAASAGQRHRSALTKVLVAAVAVVTPIVLFTVIDTSCRMTSAERAAALPKQSKFSSGATDLTDQRRGATWLPLEANEQLRAWNLPYHATRQALRDEQAALHAGPLREHTFYTTDCTQHSLWQALTLEHSWAHVNNVHGGGFLSRIVSGCGKTPQKQPQLARHVIPSRFGNAERREQAALDRRVACDVTVDDGCFGIYFVPEYQTLPNGDYYAPYNRPNGIWYWLNHTDLTEDVFILIDPDMIYLSRLHGAHLVRPGKPAAQFYEYMNHSGFARYNCSLCPTPYSFSMTDYAAGPPWFIALSDLKRVMPRWIGLVPQLREIDKGMWIVEMVAYSVACAYYGLTHTLLWRGMVDNLNQPGNVWDVFYLAGHRPTPRIQQLFEDGRVDFHGAAGSTTDDPASPAAADERLSLAVDSLAAKRDRRVGDLALVVGGVSRKHRDGRWWRTASASSFEARVLASGAAMFASTTADAKALLPVNRSEAEAAWWRHESLPPPPPADPSESELPVALLHYCYTFELGDRTPQGYPAADAQEKLMRQREADRAAPLVDYVHWSKYRLPSDWPGGKGRHPHNVLACGCPLQQEFHTPWAMPKVGPNVTEQARFAWLRTAHMVHLTIPAINEALRAYKVKYCMPEDRNFEERVKTSHPGYWLSAYHIEDYRRPDYDRPDFDNGLRVPRRYYTAAPPPQH